MIELTVVLLIVVILLTLGASVVGLAGENANISQTRKKQDAIKDALSTYLGRNKRLPCPDTDVPPDGQENRTPAGIANPCTADVGVLPYVDLGLPRDFVLDGWDNLFTYRVTTDADTRRDWTRSANFASGKPGKLDINARDSAGAIVSETAILKAVAVVVSHGKNGLGARTSQGTTNLAPAAGTDEAENADGAANLVFVRRDFTDAAAAPGGVFDDMLLIIRAADLVSPLQKDGSARSAEGETNYQIGQIVDDVYGRFVSDPDPLGPTLPPEGAGNTPPSGTRDDGWAGALKYYRCETGHITLSTSNGALAPPNTIAFRVLSGGPNQLVETGAGCPLPLASDDIAYDVTLAMLRNVASKVNKALPP